MSPPPDPDPKLTLDTLGRRCPAPIIELARHIGDVEPGEVVAVLSDDAAAALDVPAWCEMRGHVYLGSYLGSCLGTAGTAYHVRRVAPAAQGSAGSGAGSSGGGGGGN